MTFDGALDIALVAALNMVDEAFPIVASAALGFVGVKWLRRILNEHVGPGMSGQQRREGPW